MGPQKESGSDRGMSREQLRNIEFRTLMPVLCRVGAKLHSTPFSWQEKARHLHFPRHLPTLISPMYHLNGP